MCTSVTSPLPIIEYPGLEPFQIRVLHFNPTEIYSRIKIDHFKRLNSVPMGEMFLKVTGKCSCGCGLELPGRRTRWATDECQLFAVAVNQIINGHPEFVSKYLKIIKGDWACEDCGVMDQWNIYKNGIVANAIYKDHIVPVVQGGGGCWLGNYRLRCKTCHNDKTNRDFKHKIYREPTVIEYNLPTLFNMDEIF